MKKQQQLDAVNASLEAPSQIRSAYSLRDPVHMPLSGEPSRTKQEPKNDVNINTIMERLQKGIQPPAWMTANTPRYGDFTGMPTSFQEAYALVEKAEAAFESLPLEFRRAIDHDPRNLDSAPRELFEQFGLLKEQKSAGASPEPDKAPGSPPKADDRPKGDRPATGPAGPSNAPKKGASDTD